MNEEIAKTQFEVPAKEATKRAEIYAAAVIKVLRWTNIALCVPAVGVLVQPSAVLAWIVLIVMVTAFGAAALWRLFDKIT